MFCHLNNNRHVQIAMLKLRCPAADRCNLLFRTISKEIILCFLRSLKVHVRELGFVLQAPGGKSVLKLKRRDCLSFTALPLQS